MDNDIASVEGDKLGDDGVVCQAGMSEDMGKKCHPLDDGKAEEVEGDLCNRDIEDGEHSELRGRRCQ